MGVKPKRILLKVSDNKLSDFPKSLAQGKEVLKLKMTLVTVLGVMLTIAIGFAAQAWMDDFEDGKLDELVQAALTAARDRSVELSG